MASPRRVGPADRPVRARVKREEAALEVMQRKLRWVHGDLMLERLFFFLGGGGGNIQHIIYNDYVFVFVKQMLWG